MSTRAALSGLALAAVPLLALGAGGAAAAPAPAAPRTGLLAAVEAAAPEPELERGTTTTSERIRTASVQWVETGTADVAGARGNVHVGSLDVVRSGSTTSASGSVTDWQCDPGEQPEFLPEQPSPVLVAADDPAGDLADDPADGPAEEPAPPCDLVGERYLESSSLRLTASFTTGTANVTGSLSVVDATTAEPAPAAAVPVRIKLRSTGRVARVSFAHSWDDGLVSTAVTSRGRAAQQVRAQGSVGATVLGDGAGDDVLGSFSVDHVTWTTTVR